jgi:hypothetical protein
VSNACIDFVFEQHGSRRFHLLSLRADGYYWGSQRESFKGLIPLKFLNLLRKDPDLNTD